MPLERLFANAACRRFDYRLNLEGASHQLELAHMHSDRLRCQLRPPAPCVRELHHAARAMIFRSIDQMKSGQDRVVIEPCCSFIARAALGRLMSWLPAGAVQRAVGA